MKRLRSALITSTMLATSCYAASDLDVFMDFSGMLPTGWSAYLNPFADGKGWDFKSGVFEVNTPGTGAFLENSFGKNRYFDQIFVSYTTLATQSAFLSGVGNYLYNSSNQQIAFLGIGSTIDQNFQTKQLKFMSVPSLWAA